MSQQQSTNHVFHVRPVGFAFNKVAASDNSYMDCSLATEMPPEDMQAKVLKNSANFVDALSARGITVMSADGTPETPDAVFPNNWFSTHSAEPGGGAPARLILYPMAVPNRRAERRPDLIRRIAEHCNVQQENIIDLSYFEEQDKFLEGTGACIFDRVNKICFVGISNRAHRDVAEVLCKLIGYRLVPFTALDEHSKPIFHTNIMMNVGTRVALLCEDSIADTKERALVKQTLSDTGRTVIPVTIAQVRNYAGNALELEGSKGNFLAMGSTAYNSLTAQQRDAILRHVTEIVHPDVSMIESTGGGSVRCMIGELFV